MDIGKNKMDGIKQEVIDELEDLSNTTTPLENITFDIESCPLFRFTKISTVVLILLAVGIVLLLCFAMCAFMLFNDVMPCLMMTIGLIGISVIMFFVLCFRSTSCISWMTGIAIPEVIRDINETIITKS